MSDERWLRWFLVAGMACTLTASSGCGSTPSQPPQTTPPQTTTITVGVPFAGTLVGGDKTYYSAVVAPGTAYVAALAARTAPATLLSYGGDATFSTVFSANCTAGMQDAPEECAFVGPSSGYVYLLVQGSGIGHYALVVATQPTISAPANEISSLTPSVLKTGQVATRGTSSYTISGLVPSANFSLSLFALSGDADLHIGGAGLEIPCTHDHVDIGAATEGCIFAAGTDGTAAFTVTGGELNRDGTSYLLLAWPVQ